MRLFALFALSALAQDAPDYEYDEGDYDYGSTELDYSTAPPPTTVEAGTEAPIFADYVATEEATTEEAATAAPTPAMANDFVQTTFLEEPEEAVFPQDMSGFARTGGSVNPISNLQLSLLPNADFEFTWEFDGTHTDYNFEYQELVGNYQNITDYIQYAGTVSMVTDGATTTSTLTPTDTNKVFRWRITPYVNTDGGEASTIDGQSFTNTVVHQPGDVYEGGGGYSAQVLLPTEFSNANFVPTSAGDSVGYVIAVLVQFPAGCPTIRVDGDVDGNYIYTDPLNSDTHRIFVFPETHFSNQFSGPIKAFHYYVSNAAYAGCDLSDPTSQVTVSVANTFLVRTTEAATVELMQLWPSDNGYPPVEYTEQHVVDLSDHIQPATHIGPSRAISAPRIVFDTTGCDVTLNVEEDISPGWGMLDAFQSTLDMTDLWSDPPTSNTGNTFNLQALIWLTEVGITFRYDTTVTGCETILSSATITFIELDPAANLDIAVNPL